MTQPWNMAKAASKRPLRKPYKVCGPVGPALEVLPDAAGALVNGVALSHKEVFSLGIDVQELGISAYGPAGPEGGKRGDGRPICEGCGYALCSCPPKTFDPYMGLSGLNSVTRGEPEPPSVGARLAKAVESIRAEALRTGQMLTGETRLVVWAYQRIGRGGASLSAAGDIVLMCHPHDEVEVRQALGMEGP